MGRWGECGGVRIGMRVSCSKSTPTYTGTVAGGAARADLGLSGKGQERRREGGACVRWVRDNVEGRWGSWACVVGCGLG